METYSILIHNLTEIWINWIKNDLIARDASYSVIVRKEAALMCERLIKERYQVIAKIDNLFD